jgi:hypothetical protein
MGTLFPTEQNSKAINKLELQQTIQIVNNKSNISR